jgi:cytochrome b561
MKSTLSTYGRIAQAFHWLSAFFILAMLPLGLAMTRLAEGPSKTFLYQAHVGLGLLVLVLTTARIFWRFIEPTPEAPAGLSPLHKFGFKAIHFLLYFVLAVLLFSGVGVLLLSGLGLSPASVLPEAIASDLPPVFIHRIAARIYILLLLAHLGGVLLHQFTASRVMERMGIGWFPGKQA